MQILRMEGSEKVTGGNYQLIELKGKIGCLEVSFLL